MKRLIQECPFQVMCIVWLDFYGAVVWWESHLGTTTQGQEDRDILDIPSVVRKRNLRHSFVFECYDEFILFLNAMMNLLWRHTKLKIFDPSLFIYA